MKYYQRGFIAMFILLTFVMGFLFYANVDLYEGFSINKNSTIHSTKLRCPNLLVQDGKRIYLHNTQLAEVPGVNPIQFNNLEEYNEFLDWQKGQGIRCPVLFLQKSYNTQGFPVFKIRPSINEPQGGLEPSILSADGKTVVRSTLGDDDTFAYPYSDEVLNKNPVDFRNAGVFDSSIDGISPNAMDTNWGGHEFTDKLIDSGYYKNNEVKTPVK
jgi:hypothetical protein